MKLKYFFTACLLFFIIGMANAQPLNSHRIISLVPSNTELLFELGLGQHVVGVSTYCNYPAAAQKIAKVGDLELNIEKIMVLKPTLLLDLNSMHKKYELLFVQLGLNYVNLNISNLEEVADAAQEICYLLGTPQKSEEFSKNWQKSLAGFKLNKLPDPLKVYLEIWDTPMQAAGPESFMGEMIVTAGGENIISRPADYPIVNSEHIIAANPDIILISYPLGNLASIRNRPGWQAIRAVKSNNIEALPQDLFVRPGPRNIEGLRILQKIFLQARQNN
jgi:iron complex transport system substrate-binding protein